MEVHDYLRLIIIIMVTITITQINFHLTSRLLLPYISVIKVNAELKAERKLNDSGLKAGSHERRKRKRKRKRKHKLIDV